MKLNYTPKAISDIQEIRRYIGHTLYGLGRGAGRPSY